jgi:hypothetical protein
MPPGAISGDSARSSYSAAISEDGAGLMIDRDLRGLQARCGEVEAAIDYWTRCDTVACLDYASLLALI